MDQEVILKYKGELPHNLSKLNFNRQRYIGEEYIEVEHPLDVLNPTEKIHFSIEEKDLESLAREMNVDHSLMITSFLEQSLKNFKGCGRKIEEVNSYIASEYFSVSKFEEALNIYQILIPKIFDEKWFSVISPSLKNAVESSRVLNNKDSWIKFSFMALHPSVPFEDKQTLQQSIMETFSKDLESEEQMNTLIPISNDNDSIISCHFKFQKAKFYCSEKIVCQVRLKSNLPVPIRFQELSILFNISQHNQTIIDPLLSNDVRPNFDLNPNSLLLFPDKNSTFTFEFSVNEMETLSCVSISLKIARNKNFFIGLFWNLSEWDPVSENERKSIELYNPTSFVNRRNTK